MMTAHIVYPQLDPEHPATLSRRILGDLLRGEWGYEGVVITDSLVMKAIHERYGHDRAAVLALQAGADMVMALGTQAEQLAAVRAIDAARETGALSGAQIDTANARLDALAQRYPAASTDYAAPQREADDVLMRSAWARGLTGVAAPRVPRLDQPLRVYTQRSVPCDGVSEAGPSGAQVAALFEAFGDVEVVQLGELRGFDWSVVPRDGRTTVLEPRVAARPAPGALESVPGARHCRARGRDLGLCRRCAGCAACLAGGPRRAAGTLAGTADRVTRSVHR
jgi:beta-N-acetylhexosaminidase